MKQVKTKNQKAKKVLNKFANNLLSKQKDLEPYFNAFIDEHFWELI